MNLGMKKVFIPQLIQKSNISLTKMFSFLKLSKRCINTVCLKDLEKKFTRLSDLRKLPLDEEVIAKGWVRSIRKHKNLAFININDGSLVEGFQVSW